MSGNEDDKPTVVLDLKALQEQEKNKDTELEEIASDLSFTAGTGTQDAPMEEFKIDLEEPVSDEKKLVVLFDYNSQYFSNNQSKFPQEFEYVVVTDLKELNKHLQSDGTKAVVFNYNAAPKAANQLCAQIKSKFPSARTLIIAKNLSPEKAQAHAKSSSGANGYVSAPFKLSALKDEINKILAD